jgi:hypothetical protein
LLQFNYDNDHKLEVRHIELIFYHKKRFNGMDLGLKASFIYWNPAQSGTFGSSPWVKHEERSNY